MKRKIEPSGVLIRRLDNAGKVDAQVQPYALALFVLLTLPRLELAIVKDCSGLPQREPFVDPSARSRLIEVEHHSIAHDDDRLLRRFGVELLKLDPKDVRR